MRSHPFRSLLACFLCALFLGSGLTAGAVSASAASAVLMDAHSGRVLYEKDCHARRPVASVTKLMTALVCVDSVPDLDVTVTVDPRAVGVEGSSLYLTAGEELPLRHLLYGLLLHSGNDAAAAIAIFCAGDVETFVGWMNEKAAALGLADTHFANPSGLDHPEHWSSAFDLALIAREVLTRDTLAEMVATDSITLGARTFVNHNKLLRRYPGCVGLKTGYTDSAGRTLVSAARRDGTTLICVTLNDPNDWSDHQALLDYGFSAYRGVTLASAGEPLALIAVRGSLIPAVPVAAAWTVNACLAEGETVSAQLLLPPSTQAPVRRGQPLGRLLFTLSGDPIGSVDLVAAADAPLDRPGGLPGVLDHLRAALLRPIRAISHWTTSAERGA